MIFLKIAAEFLLILSMILVSFFLWLNMDTSLPISWNTGRESMQEQEKKDKEKAEDKEQTVRITRQDGTSLRLPLKTYLEEVIGSEAPASFEVGALKAQYVVARTFVTKRGFEVDDTTRTQVCHGDKQMRQIWESSCDKMCARVMRALQGTEGEIMAYQGKPVSAVFFSGSCGKTANSEEYWDSRTPYLRSVDSHWDKEEDGCEKIAVISEEDFHTMLGFGNPVKEAGKPSHYASNYVESIAIDRIVSSGREIHEKLSPRSSCFSIRKTSGGYAVTTRGFGHGLGIGQCGAQGIALKKKNYKEILKHYYTGVQIVKEWCIKKKGVGITITRGDEIYDYTKEKEFPKRRLIAPLSCLLIAAAAFLIYEHSMKNPAKNAPVFKEDTTPMLSLPGSAEEEKGIQPFAVKAEVVLDYLDGKDSKVGSMTEFEGICRADQGMGYFFSKEAFGILASFSGEVSDVKEDSIFDKSVAITSKDLSITYQSLFDTTMKKGDKVNQKDLIAEAGSNIYNKELGNHLHIVIEKSGKAIDPKLMYGKTNAETR